MRSDLVDIEVRVVSDDPTKQAIAVVDGVTMDLGTKNPKWFWLPRSQIEYTEPDRADRTTVTLPEWLAVDKGLV